MSQAPCQTIKSIKIRYLRKKPRSEDRGTFAGRATIAGQRPSRGRGPCRVKHQPETVDAIAQAGRLRTVIEDVAEVTAAAAAMHFGAQHAEGAVLGLAERIVERLPETRPAGATLIFGVRREQRQVASGTGKGAFALLFQERA